jgi:glycosyltransferase involved in cell wall biosynthesis/uncharacterized SAM-binding protein YcdF (DUF218 family)
MHVISGLDQGGAEAMLVRLLRALDRELFSQSVVSLRTRGVYGDQIEASGIPLLTLGMTGFTATPRSVAVLCRAIREWQPDIVQTWLYHADLLGLVAARIAGDASVAWNVRCSSLAPGDVARSTRLLTKVLARLSARPDAVLFNSTAGGEAHRAINYRPRRSEVIPNGFDLDERRPDPVKRAEFRHEINVGPDAFLVGMIARAHRVKDQTTFLAAAARLKGMSGSVRFVMVGLNHTWDNPSLVAEIDRYGLRDRIILLGLRQDVPRIMAGLDCLVSTSTSEGFPNVIGEAMACGVPCVATDAGDSRLIIGNTGTILPIGDVAGVVGGVSELMDLSAEERQTRSAQCRHRIVEHFELSHIAARYADFYSELNDRRLAWQRGLPVDAGRTERVTPTRWPASVRGLEGGAFQAASPVATVDAPSVAQATTSPASPRGRRRVAVSLAALVVLYGLVFYTPLVWFAGDVLTIRQEPVHADAIVVFSGNGESSYINDSYQRRARDAARYYKAGYAPLLVISSGIEQTFAEVEIIRALLLSQGVPAEAMHIIPKYPATTHENVEVVYDFLNRREMTSILFITAPYHSRRASLIWKKVAPEVTVTTVPVVDTPPAIPQWHASLDQIKAIAYEYLAIAYNRSKGWL